MPQYARVKLTSSNLDELEKLAWEIKDIAQKAGVKSMGRSLFRRRR